MEPHRTPTKMKHIDTIRIFPSEYFSLFCSFSRSFFRIIIKNYEILHFSYFTCLVFHSPFPFFVDILFLFVFFSSFFVRINLHFVAINNSSGKTHCRPLAIVRFRWRGFERWTLASKHFRDLWQRRRWLFPWKFIIINFIILEVELQNIIESMLRSLYNGFHDRMPSKWK